MFINLYTYRKGKFVLANKRMVKNKMVVRTLWLSDDNLVYLIQKEAYFLMAVNFIFNNYKTKRQAGEVKYFCGTARYFCITKFVKFIANYCIRSQIIHKSC